MTNKTKMIALVSGTALVGLGLALALKADKPAHLLCATPVGMVSLDSNDGAKFSLSGGRVILHLPESTVSLPAEMCIIETKN